MSDAGAPAAGAPLLRRRFAARAAELRAVREAVRREALAQGCAPECAGDIVMAVDEACQNIIRHAYAGRSDGEIVLEIERSGEELLVSLRDFAPPVDPSRVRPRDLDDVRPGGLGTHLIRELTDGAGFAPAPPGGGNLFRIRKRIRERSPSDEETE
jgi:sigma-B regulation protein RsbU (phosphoserine phosphatase)